MQHELIYDKTIQHYWFNDYNIAICAPVNVQAQYEKVKLINPDAPFPFWAKVWPAAKATCQYLADNLKLFQEKKIIEVAAGLAAPGIFLAKYTNSTITCSDYLPAILPYIQQSALANNCSIQTRLYNWTEAPPPIPADILLLSDVNYDPAAFPYIQKLITHFLLLNTTIVLSTPQRISAVKFMEYITPYIQEHKTYLIDGTRISVIVLKKSSGI